MTWPHSYMCVYLSLVLVFYSGNEYHSRLTNGINAALARVKDYDTDTRESLRQELMQSAELLDQAARLAMAAMLQVGVLLC